MNILKHELRTGIKPFIFWTLGLFFLVFAGLTKYTGIAATSAVDITKLMDQFPKVVLALFGMVGIDIKSFGGYFAVLEFYAMLCAAIYAISLGAGAVNREAIDKTYEFIFTKPLSRKKILGIKLLSGIIYLAAFCVLNVVFSFLAVPALNITENINTEMLLFGASVFLVGILFFAVGAFFAAISKKSERGSLYGNLSFLTVFVIGVIYDMLDNAGFLRIFTPLKYFQPADLLVKNFNLTYMAVCITAAALLLWQAIELFDKKDLNAA